MLTDLIIYVKAWHVETREFTSYHNPYTRLFKCFFPSNSHHKLMRQVIVRHPYFPLGKRLSNLSMNSQLSCRTRIRM